MLTTEQREIVEAPPGERILVTAGPGTGKTHTLVARIGHLVEHHDLHPGHILALSFSRAAVGELQRRLRATGQDAGRVAPVTFDSFATRLLARVDPDGSWVQDTYDGRIATARDRIGEIGDFLSEIEHVLVDEVQDLVGVRMRFVRDLLCHLDIGFTLLGDPAQGIYDFSLSGGETPATDGAPALYTWLRDTYPGVLREETLDENHRSKTETITQAALLGPAVVSSPVDAAEQLFALVEDAPRLPSLRSLQRIPAAGRTAILCRNNGQALWVARELQANGIEHVFQRKATARCIAPWVAGVVAATGGGIVTRSRFDEALTVLTCERPEPSEAWAILRRTARDSSPGVNLALLAERIREGRVPDELHVQRPSSIVVSTVHRAKGLEFDRVVLVKDGWGLPFDDEAAKTLFVAVTRTISMLVTVDLPKVDGRLRLDPRSNRWIHTGWKDYQRRGIEMYSDDIEVRQPAGAFILGEDALAIQQLLAAQVSAGDPAELQLLRPRAGLPGAIYSVHWNGKVIGMTSDTFGTHLGWLVGNSKWGFPKRIVDLSIDAVRSVGGDEMVARQAGLGPGGVWLAPALVGMGKFDWSERDD